jgi:hypothetical protein
VSREEKVFLFLTLFILCLTLASFVSAMTKQNNAKELTVLSELTKLPGFARSTSFLEHRISLYKDNSNRLYPKMFSTGKMDFVYAQ